MNLLMSNFKHKKTQKNTLSTALQRSKKIFFKSFSIHKHCFYMSLTELPKFSPNRERLADEDEARLKGKDS